jgi:hypothetical protein
MMGTGSIARSAANQHDGQISRDLEIRVNCSAFLMSTVAGVESSTHAGAGNDLQTSDSRNSLATIIALSAAHTLPSAASAAVYHSWPADWSILLTLRGTSNTGPSCVRFADVQPNIICPGWGL